MPLYHIIILSIIQGITEFLPISSSGHLILAHAALEGSNAPQGWNQHLMIDVAVHVGTLFAVLLYFHHDVMVMAKGAVNLLRGNISHTGTQLNIKIIIGSLPVIIIGFVVNSYAPSQLLAVEIVAWTTLIFGVILWFTDRAPIKYESINQITYKNALLIGMAQCLALIPGTSRSGITMITARFLGHTPHNSAKFSMLLGIIAISGAGALSALSASKDPTMTLTWDVIIAALLSFISGLIAITLMMNWLKRASFMPFVIYRVVLGIVLLTLIYMTDLL